MARNQAPSGQDIASKAKSGKLDRAKSTTAQKGGKRVTFTQADMSHVSSVTDLEDGQFIGELDAEAPGDNLKPGRYNMFIVKVGSEWQVLAEADGKVAGKAKSVRERKDKPPGDKPAFREGSFCWWVWLIFTGFEWCF